MPYKQFSRAQKFIPKANQGKRCLIDVADRFETATAEYAGRKILRKATEVARQAEHDRRAIEHGENEVMK